MGHLSLRVWVLENVEAELRLYDQAGGEERKEEEMEGMKERGREVAFFVGGRGSDRKNPPPSRLNKVALNGHVGDR
jgi:hypothetical protein